MNAAHTAHHSRPGSRSLVCALIKLAALAVISIRAHGQTVLRVDDDAAPGGDGLSWPTAFDSLQAGLDAAALIASPANPVELRIAQGVYVPTKRTDAADPRSATFQLLNNVSLMGGYAGVGSGNADLRDIDAFETILSGDINGDDGPDFANYDENTYHVMTASGVDASTLLDGISVMSGNANVDNGVEAGTHLGAGLYFVTGQPTIRNCRFRNNSAINGGGVYARLSSAPTIIDCLFEGNAAESGAAMRQRGPGSTVIRRSTFFNNSSNVGAVTLQELESVLFADCDVVENQGGSLNCLVSGIQIENCHFAANIGAIGGGLAAGFGCIGTVSECEFVDNSVTSAGGGASLSGAIVVRNCSFRNNQSVSYGGGAFASSANGNTEVSFVNCSFAKNVAGVGGGLYYTDGVELFNCTLNANQGGGMTALQSAMHSGTLRGINSIIWGNVPAEWSHDLQGSMPQTPTLEHCAILGGWTGPGSNNIDLDPMFIQPGCGNLRLAHGSPCIDAGDNSAIPSGITTDLDGNPRILNGIVDMGAYEGGHDMLPATACENDLDSGEFVRLIPSGGPFNPQVSAAVNVTNITETNNAWATVTESHVHLHPWALGYRDLATILTFETSLANGQMFTRVMIPFDADDVGILDPLEVDVTYFDPSANRWYLAAEGNTVNSPGHSGPVGDRIVRLGTGAPYGFTGEVGDHGVFWNAKKQRGFAWANVDHATDFGAGTLLSSCPADCAAPSGVVGPADLMTVIAAWGVVVVGDPADVTADNIVNIDDLIAVVNAWGPCR